MHITHINRYIYIYNPYHLFSNSQICNNLLNFQGDSFKRKLPQLVIDRTPVIKTN